MEKRSGDGLIAGRADAYQQRANQFATDCVCVTNLPISLVDASAQRRSHFLARMTSPFSPRRHWSKMQQSEAGKALVALLVKTLPESNVAVAICIAPAWLKPSPLPRITIGTAAGSSLASMMSC